ncbi:MAG TPA: DUF86 domain-containing protein [Vicinamibacterales bacterium]|nr:DUF86 domain-containing protein [Vicinamibacterales bacterium]
MSDDRVYLQHIRDAANDIATYCETDRDGFFKERIRQDATLRKLGVIGEAVKNLSEQTKARMPAIPWKEIAGMRDKVVHHYFGVDLEIVWGVVQQDLPKLETAVSELLAQREPIVGSDDQSHS